jgi:hypothetical protein
MTGPQDIEPENAADDGEWWQIIADVIEGVSE